MKRLVVVSNRLPLVISKAEVPPPQDSPAAAGRTAPPRFSIREGAGGLVTALNPLLDQRGGAWIGFGGMYDTDRGTGWEPTLDEHGGRRIRYYPVTPPRSVYEGYYLHYANQELWPRFHGMTGKMSADAAGFWRDYVQMNRLFAEQTRQVAEDENLVWIHDYHLMLLPQMLRETHPRAALGHFLHIPFPPAEIMVRQPHARKVMEGVLAADLLGFHIPAYMDHFIESAERIVSARVLERTEASAILEVGSRRTRLGAFPIGIELAQLQDTEKMQAVRRRLQGAADTLILSMDRLDYTKAIPPRLEAYARLLDDYPEYCGKVSLVQLLDVSRKSIPAYQEERDKVDRVVASIRQRHQGWKPLFFSAERWPREEVAGLMHLARICLVTPRCDGMNLVSKEYVAGAPDDGVLVLSRQAGAAWQLGEHAVLVDGNSPESIVQGLRTALEMPADERRARMARLKDNVAREDVFWWAGRFLDELSAR